MTEKNNTEENIEDILVNTPMGWKEIAIYLVGFLFLIGYCTNSDTDLKTIESKNKGIEIINELTEEYDEEYRDLNDKWIKNGKNHTESLKRSRQEVQKKYEELLYNLNMNTDLHPDDKYFLENLIQNKWYETKSKNFK